LLAGDPHIRFSVPSVWYEAQLSAPGFELYGYHRRWCRGVPGHNRDFGWSLTMFQNDDLDLIAEKVNPDNPTRSGRGQWVDMTSTEQQIAVKGEAPVTLTLRRRPTARSSTTCWATAPARRRSPCGGRSSKPRTRSSKASTSSTAPTPWPSARRAAKVSAPGLNIVWANAKGDIGWWAAAQLPIRPAGVNPGSSSTAAATRRTSSVSTPSAPTPGRKPGARLHRVGQCQPVSPTGMEIPGYYNLADRGQQLNAHLSDKSVKWDVNNSQALQLGTTTAYGPRLLAPLLPVLRDVVRTRQLKLVEQLAAWKGDYPLDSTSATLFNQFLFNLADAALRRAGRHHVQDPARHPRDRRRPATPGRHGRLTMVERQARRHRQARLGQQPRAPQGHLRR
jgi:penicillin amidase